MRTHTLLILIYSNPPLNCNPSKSTISSHKKKKQYKTFLENQNWSMTVVALFSSCLQIPGFLHKTRTSTMRRKRATDFLGGFLLQVQKISLSLNYYNIQRSLEQTENKSKGQIFKKPRQNSSSTHQLPPFFYASFCYESSAQQQPRGRQRHEEEEEEEESLITFHHKTKRNRREAGSEAGSGIPHP